MANRLECHDRSSRQTPSCISADEPPGPCGHMSGEWSTSRREDWHSKAGQGRVVKPSQHRDIAESSQDSMDDGLPSSRETTFIRLLLRH